MGKLRLMYDIVLKLHQHTWLLLNVNWNCCLLDGEFTRVRESAVFNYSRIIFKRQNEFLVHKLPGSNYDYLFVRLDQLFHLLPSSHLYVILLFPLLYFPFLFQSSFGEEGGDSFLLGSENLSKTFGKLKVSSLNHIQGVPIRMQSKERLNTF